MRLSAASILLLLAAPAAPARADDPASSVAVVVVGDREPARAIRDGLERDHDLPVTLALHDLPTADRPEQARGARSEIAGVLASAREHYIAARFDLCVAALEGEERVASLLGEGQRELGARILFWRTACHVGAGDNTSAERAARALAVHALGIPPDVEAATPEVESLLATALRETEQAPRVHLEVRSEPAGTLRIDGGEPVCRTPCTAEVVAGDHVVTVEAAGFVPTSRTIRVSSDGGQASLGLPAASPEVAAAQWHARYAASGEIDSTESVSLLVRAIRARRLVVLSALTEGDGARVRGALSVEGRVAARAERGPNDGDPEDAAEDVVRELLVDAHIVEPARSIWQSPWVWVGIIVAAAGAAALTAALLYDPGTRTVLTW